MLMFIKRPLKWEYTTSSWFGLELFGLVIWKLFASKLNGKENGKIEKSLKKNLTYYDVVCTAYHSKSDLLWQVSAMS